MSKRRAGNEQLGANQICVASRIECAVSVTSDCATRSRIIGSRSVANKNVSDLIETDESDRDESRKEAADENLKRRC